MPRFVAFLRAVNVGGRIVKMERLRDMLTALGCRDVKTFIASGNVIFTRDVKTAKALEAELERSLQDEFGFEIVVMIRTDQEVRKAAAGAPFSATESEATNATLYIGFCKSAPTADAIRAVVELSGANDSLQVRDRELFWLCRTRISDSPVSGARIEKLLRTAVTVRNVTTVRKIAALCATD